MRKKSKKEEELPRFLLNLKTKPEEIDLPVATNTVDDYLGPIFFGGCTQYHPPPHSLHLGSFHHVNIADEQFEDNFKNIFLPKVPSVKKTYIGPQVCTSSRKRKLFEDPYPHRCPGTRKAIHDVHPHVVDLGETISTIQGETSREIPMFRLKRVSSRTLEEEYEIVTLSDIWEKKRKFMSWEKRAAHAHFLKEFADVTVIGPTIPASITIMKIPSKRKRLSELNFSAAGKHKEVGDEEKPKEEERPEEVTDKTEEETTGEEEETMRVDSKEEESRRESDKESQQIDETEEEEGCQSEGEGEETTMEELPPEEEEEQEQEEDVEAVEEAEEMENDEISPPEEATD